MAANQGWGEHSSGNWVLVLLAWAAVGIPLGWGVFMTLKKAALLFK
ncbi:MAG: MFS transporter small subunit [bacterium]